MMATKRDIREELQRAADNGYPVDFGALDAPFNFLISSITSLEVDERPITKLSQRVREIVRTSGFKCELAGIIVFPMVLDPEVPAVGDKVSWKRKSNIYSVHRHIDIFRWEQAKLKEKKEMLLNCVIDSISSIPTKRLSESSKEALVAIVRQAMRSSAARRPAN
jgi:hypothetical protein